MEDNRTMNAIKKRKIVMGVMITLIVLMLVAVITLSVLLGMSKSNEKEFRIGVENVYRHAYYALLENYVDIETGLNKVKLLHSAGLSEEVLDKIADNAELAALSLNTLNTNENNLEPIYRFTNQVGDYSKYLVRKLEKGGAISEEEMSTIDKMHGIAMKLGKALASVNDEIHYNGYSFIDNLGKNNDSFSIALKELDNGSIEYPSLIYDGPFSDSLETRVPKGLKGDEITKEQGINKIKEFFRDATDVKFVSESSNHFVTYLYDVTYRDGATGSIQLTKVGGQIVMTNTFAECLDIKVDEESAERIAATFLIEHGYINMAVVWSSLNDSTYYFNYAPKVNGVIYYSNVIKVKVCAGTGRVIGMEALNYIYNHTERNVDISKVMSEEKAIENVPKSFDISKMELALIPKGNDNEVLTYEIIGTIGEDTFYLYINAETGEDEKVLMQINSNGGKLLL